MKDADYLTLELPWAWGRVSTMVSGTAKLTATLTSTQTPAKVYGATTVTYSVNCAVVTLKTGDKLVENADYVLTVNGVPTPDNAMANQGAVIVSVGKAASGGTGWTSSQLWKFAAPSFAVESGMTLLKFSASSVTVNVGQFSGAVCVMPSAGNFVGDVSFTTSGMDLLKTLSAK